MKNMKNVKLELSMGSVWPDYKLLPLWPQQLAQCPDLELSSVEVIARSKSFSPIWTWAFLSLLSLCLNSSYLYLYLDQVKLALLR